MVKCVESTSQTRAPTLDAQEVEPKPQAVWGLLVVGGAACLSASAMFVKLADVNAGTAAFLRCAVALVPLVPMLMRETRRHRRLPGSLEHYSLLAGVFLGVDYVMWSISILDIGAAIAAV